MVLATMQPSISIVCNPASSAELRTGIPHQAQRSPTGSRQTW